jgi:hypothetical protein
MSESEKTAIPKVMPIMRQPAQEHEQEEPGRQPSLQAQPDPVAQVGCREGDASCAGAHASTLSRATDAHPGRAQRSLLRLQRQYGNRFVRRVVDLSRKGQGAGDVTPEVEAAIQRERGGGQALDSAARAQMEPAMGADFSGVRVHTGGQADTLNRDLSARAFTTGQDIFFKQGEYSPGSSTGRELLAHELTHVVQQDGDRVRRKLTVGAAGDQYEQEADQVASSVMRQEQQPGQDVVHRQGAPEEEEKKDESMQAKLEDGQVQRQAEEEEQKDQQAVQMKLDDGALQRQAEEERQEEEPVQMKLDDGSLRRQAEEEDKEPMQTKQDGSLQRQGESEDEKRKRGV